MRRDEFFKVSVIMPVYNAATYIDRAIVSAQKLEEVLEIIIVDDASKDASMQIARTKAEDDSRIVLLSTGKSTPQGSAVARNIGIRQAQAPFIAFLDADDYYLPNRFECTPDLFGRDADTEAVIEAVSMVDPYGLNSGSLAPRGRSSISLALDFFRFNNRGPHLNGLTVRKTVLESLVFDEDLFYAQDTLFFSTLFLYHQVRGSCEDQRVAAYVIHGNNSIFKKDIRNKIDPLLSKKLLSLVSSSLPYAIRFYLFKRSLVRQCSSNSKLKVIRYLCYLKTAILILFQHPLLFPGAFLRAYIFDKGRP